MGLDGQNFSVEPGRAACSDVIKLHTPKPKVFASATAPRFLIPGLDGLAAATASDPPSRLPETS